jgi:membrane AbrB-like protein
MPLPAHIHSIGRVAETLLTAAAGGLAFVVIGFPAGLISGSVLAVSIAALIGRPVVVPLLLARVCYVLIGILLGAVVTPETLKGVAAYPLSIAVLAVAAVAMTVATASYLRRVHGWDAMSALFGASPGSMAQVMVMSAEYGADLRAIAIVQTTRVLLLTVGMPAGLALFGLTAGATPATSAVAGQSSVFELAMLVTVATLGAVALLWLRFPGGLLFGAMAGSGILHGTGLVTATLPWWITAAAVVTLGAVIGAWFANTTVWTLIGYAGAALGSFAVSIAVAACFALAVASFLPFSIADVVVAFAPGAQDTMMVLALALHLDPVFIGAHHLSRYLVVTFSIAMLARHFAKKLPRPRDDRPRKRRGSGSFDD